MRTRAKNRIVTFSHSLSLKLFVMLLFMVTILFAGYTTLCSTMQQRIYERTIELSAYRASDLVKKSLHRMMLRNEREALFHTIRILGEEPGVETVRIYNKRGEITFSTLEKEIGTTVDMRAEACYACHAANEPLVSLPMKEKTRIYMGNKGYRIMGMINPIRNDAECSTPLCHAHSAEQTILGVLDVQMALSDLDKAVQQTRVTVFSYSVGFLVLAMLIFSLSIYFLIYRPIQQLQGGTVRLAVGDLDHRIKMNRKDELGLLARSFNNMAENLRRAYGELKEWSVNLEKRMEEKTEELARMHRGMMHVEKMASLGKMAATVAHELNNPLAGVVTYSKLVQKKIDRSNLSQEEKQKIMDHLNLISGESLRCGNIVRNLLAFAKGAPANFREFPVRELFERALQIVQHHLKLAEIEPEIRLDLSRENIICDFDQLLQAIVALLMNAVEAMPSGGQLILSAYDSPERAEHIVIRISDTGTGISDEVRDKIFEPFFSTKEDANGVGLGLAVVYGIIQRHRGKIKLETEEGKGTTFVIEIPVSQQEIEK